LKITEIRLRENVAENRDEKTIKHHFLEVRKKQEISAVAAK
jgi:hypothetical protein